MAVEQSPSLRSRGVDHCVEVHLVAGDSVSRVKIPETVPKQLAALALVPELGWRFALSGRLQLKCAAIKKTGGPEKLPDAPDPFSASAGFLGLRGLSNGPLPVVSCL